MSRMKQLLQIMRLIEIFKTDFPFKFKKIS